jgi:hypothetical protein
MKTKNIFSKVTGLVIALTLVLSTTAQAAVSSQTPKDSISDAVQELIIKNYGAILEDSRLDPGLSVYIHKKVTGETVEVKTNVADAYYSVSFEGSGKTSTILELLQYKFDQLKASGYPITPDRYLIKITEENGRTYVAVALDETYVYPQRVSNK